MFLTVPHLSATNIWLTEEETFNMKQLKTAATTSFAACPGLVSPATLVARSQPSKMANNLNFSANTIANTRLSNDFNSAKRVMAILMNSEQASWKQFNNTN